MQLQLTFIPSNYWTEKTSDFRLRTQAALPPKESGFFFLWLPANTDEDTLKRQITHTFPQIPVEKLLSAEMRLAQVNYNDQSQIGSNSSPLIQRVYPVPKVFGKILPLPPALKMLFKLDIVTTEDRTQKYITYSESIKTWAFLTKFTFELLTRGNFVPILEPLDEKRFEGRWKIVLKTQFDHSRYKTILRNAPWAAYGLPINFISAQKDSPYASAGFITNGLWHPGFLFSDYMDTIADFLIRTSLSQDYFQKFQEFYGVSLDSSCSIDNDKISWDLRFLRACIGKDRVFEIQKFCDTPIPNILKNWVRNTQGFSFDQGVSFTFRLEYPKSEEADWSLSYYLQPLTDPNYFLPLKELWNGNITTKEEFANACDDTNTLQEEILRALGTASKYFPPIARSLEGKNPQQVKLVNNEVMDFLRNSMFLLIQAGFNVVLPDEFAQTGQQRLTARLVISPKGKATRKRTGIGAAQSQFNMDSIMEYHWEARLEGKQLTEQEFLSLADAKEPLIYWRDQWIMVDPQDMDTLKPIFEQKAAEKPGMALKGELSYFEAVKLGMLGQIQLNELGSQYEVKLEGDFSDLVTTLKTIDHFESVAVPANFKGQLRPYQETALTWLSNMARLNLGVCLADDMGLGKTIEVISFLLAQKKQYPKETGAILVVCPTSVLFNWKREVAKFAPDLDVVEHYGADRSKDVSTLQALTKPHRIILTTYGTVRNDIEYLETIQFQGIIIDESQNIKNYKTQQTQAIYHLKGSYRIALSGTPIENRMLELWSLFEFLNPGLFGTRNEFQTKFVLQIERYRDEEVTSKFRRIISPFILRRLKTDKTIIQDLPEKNEIKVYLQLSALQKQLYSQVADATLKEIEKSKADQFRRKGLILGLLVRLKQIINHPYQYQHLKIKSFADPATIIERESQLVVETPANGQSAEDEADTKETKPVLDLENVAMDDFIAQSQKLERLLDMIEEILEKGEKIILFTQFKQMGDLLKIVFEAEIQITGIILAWGCSRETKAIVSRCIPVSRDGQSPILILSLRAGGTGLNLTQAHMVFHYDRWWNPAVENQATDRAYRIGQKHQVNVYKFVSEGTIEEKIDAMLEEKRNLADKIITGAGETWITDLSDDELKELFTLKS